MHALLHYYASTVLEGGVSVRVLADEGPAVRPSDA
jgi:hypothetical protein